MGLPIVSTRHSGIPELVEDAVSGFLVEERDVVREVAARAAEGVRVFASDGIVEAMNRFNAG